MSTLKNSFPYFAFLDVDETLISLKSMFDFLLFFYKKKDSEKASTLYQENLSYLQRLAQESSRETVNAAYYRLFKGERFSVIEEIGQEWFLYHKLHTHNFYHPLVLNQIEKHKQQGAGIVLVSGSFLPCISPISKDVLADDYLCVQLELQQGIVTGNILGIQTIGEGKANALKKFAKEQEHCDLEKCFAYGDHISDLPMLLSVGHPVVYPNCEKLYQYAIEKKWEIVR